MYFMFIAPEDLNQYFNLSIAPNDLVGILCLQILYSIGPNPCLLVRYKLITLSVNN